MNDLDFETQTVVRREINQKGKSRAFINDTPVFGAAHVSIAMGCGTDIAKSGADVILLNNNLLSVYTLRNIAKTAPYMHSGNFATLREATEFYSEGRGHAVPEGVDMLLHWHIAEPDLSEDEIDRLVDFMHTLSDETFTPKTPTRIPSGLPINL